MDLDGRVSEISLLGFWLACIYRRVTILDSIKGYIAFFLVFLLNALLGRAYWHVFQDIVHFAWMCRLLRAINMLGTSPLFPDWRRVWSPRNRWNSHQKGVR